MAIFFYFKNTSDHLYPLQVENCDSNSRLVVDEDDNGKLGLERVKGTFFNSLAYLLTRYAAQKNDIFQYSIQFN